MVCVVLCIVAAAIDLKSRKIPNILTVPALALGLILSILNDEGGGYDVAAAAMGVALLGGLFALMAVKGGVGWGDTKLIAAVGALLGWPLRSWSLVLFALVYTALVGGAMALIAVIRRRRLSATVKGVAALGRKKKKEQDEPQGSGVTIPYGVAICVGTLWAVAGRYVPALLIG